MGGNIPSKEDQRVKASQNQFRSQTFLYLYRCYYTRKSITLKSMSQGEKLWGRAQRTVLQSLSKPVEHTSSWGWPALIATLLPSNDRRKGVRTAAESK